MKKLKLKIRPQLKALLIGASIVILTCAIAVPYLQWIKLTTPGRIKVTDNIVVATDNSTTSSPLKLKQIGQELKQASQNNFDSDYDVAPVAQAKGTVRIPVITYHHTAPLPSDPKSRDYFVSPTIMDAQMAYLANKGYRSITPQEFYDQLATGQNPKQKLVMITFDDGGADNYTYAFPILKKYGMIGVFYVPSSRHGMTNAQLKEMSDAGMVIDPHGKTHMMLAKVTDSAVLASEIGDSKIALEHLTGKKVVSFCYPGCEYNGTVISTLKSDGYKLAFSCGKSIDHKISGSYVLSRMHVYNDMNNFKSILSGVWYYPAPYAD